MEVLVTPEGPGIKEEVHGKNHVIVKYEPGNMTSYRVLMTRLDYQAGRVAGCSDGAWVIQWLNAGYQECRPFILGDAMGFVSFTYFMEKTGLGEGDGVALYNLLCYKFPSATGR